MEQLKSRRANVVDFIMIDAEVKLKYRRCQTEISPYMQNVQGQMLHSVSKLFDSYHFFDDLWKICFHRGFLRACTYESPG